MRYLLVLILLSFVTNACTGPETVARDETINVTGYDFSEYTDKGFLITPEQYLGDYQSIGLITVTQWPEVKEQEVMRPVPGKARMQRVTKMDHGEINVRKAIDEIYKVAKDMGADAITRFDVTPTERKNGTLVVPGVEISGFAIEREDK